MRLRNCKRCGNPYETDRPDTYFCPACSADAKKETVIRNRVFRQCGVTARRNGKWQAAYKGHYIGIFDDIPSANEAIIKYREEHGND